MGSSLHGSLLPCVFMQRLIFTWIKSIPHTSMLGSRDGWHWKLRTKLFWWLRASRHIPVQGEYQYIRELRGWGALHGRWQEITMTPWGPTMPPCSGAGPGLRLPPSSPSATTVLAAGRVLGLQHGSCDQMPHQLVACRLSAGRAPCKRARAVMWHCWAELKPHNCMLV